MTLASATISSLRLLTSACHAVSIVVLALVAVSLPSSPSLEEISVEGFTDDFGHEGWQYDSGNPVFIRRPLDNLN